MLCRVKAFCLYIGMMLVCSIAGCIFNSNSKKPVMLHSGIVERQGSRVTDIDNGIFIPDGEGGVLWSPSFNSSDSSVSEELIQAQELRLQVKELASQLLDTRSNEVLIGSIALPTSFVNLNNFSESSSLGRYMSEAMIYEFNQRGFPVKEYRMDNKIRGDMGTKGEFVLNKNMLPLSVKNQSNVLLVGTYLKENSAIFINVRLVRASDGLVLRTGQLILPENALLRRMTSVPTQDKVHVVPKKPPISKGKIKINSK